jgi:hypothetical protein
MNNNSIYDIYNQINLIDQACPNFKKNLIIPDSILGDPKEIHTAVAIYIQEKLKLRQGFYFHGYIFAILCCFLTISPFILLLTDYEDNKLLKILFILLISFITIEAFIILNLRSATGSDRIFNLFFKYLEPEDIFTIASMKGLYQNNKIHEILEILVNKCDEHCARPWTTQETESMCNWLFLSRNKQDIALELKILTLLEKYGNADIFEKRLRKVLQSWLVWRRDQKTYYEMQNCLKALVDKR